VRLGREVFKTGWPQDALRHSYGSYRNAMIRALPQVAEEMGTSENMLKKHYHNPKTKEEGEAWFGLRPSV
jgi:predicted urease superfamily metal-dependent hydrolase